MVGMAEYSGKLVLSCSFVNNIVLNVRALNWCIDDCDLRDMGINYHPSPQTSQSTAPTPLSTTALSTASLSSCTTSSHLFSAASL